MRTIPRFWIRRAVVLGNVLSLVLGTVLVVVGTLLAKQSVIATLLGLIGGAFVSASIVTLVLGALAVRGDHRAS